MNEKFKFHHKHELEHLYNIYVEIKHYNSLTYFLHWQKNNYTHILQTNPNNLMPVMVRICHQSLSSNHFSTQLSFYWGTSLVQTDLNKLKVKCCRLEIYSAKYEKSPTIWWIKSHNSGMIKLKFHQKVYRP